MPSEEGSVHRIEELRRQEAEEDGYEPRRMILDEKARKAVKQIVWWIEEDGGIVASEAQEEERNESVFSKHDDDLESVVDSSDLGGQDMTEKSRSLPNRGPGFLLDADGSYPSWFILDRPGMYAIDPKRKKLPLTIPEEDLRETFNRGGGKGGQAINKNMSRCDLLHTPTGLIIRCQETRSLSSNRTIARRRLAKLLDWGIRGEKSVIGEAIAAERKRKAQREKAAIVKAKVTEEKKKLKDEQGIKGPSAKAKSIARADKQKKKQEERESKMQRRGQRQQL